MSKQQTNRYARQTILPEIGPAGQEKLSRASVLCVGAGGLGSPALLYLAAAGIGNISIIDFDRIDESNLQRQILFSTPEVGASKAQTAKQRLQALNPHIRIKEYETALTDKNASELFTSHDIIIDGTDNFAAKFLINDAAVKHQKPWIYGAIQGFDGQASVFDTQNGPCYRCLYPQAPKGHIPNCAEAGVIGAVAGIIGTTQALQAIQIITGHENFEPLIGKLWTLDTRTMQTRTLNISKNPSCPVCNKSPGQIILQYDAPLCTAIPAITPAQAASHKQDAIVIDVREQDEWNESHLETARHWPLSKMMNGNTPDVSKDEKIILLCQKGMRSMQAAHILKAKGFTNIYNLTGGYDAWLAEKQENSTSWPEQ